MAKSIIVRQPRSVPNTKVYFEPVNQPPFKIKFTPGASIRDQFKEALNVMRGIRIIFCR